MNTHRHAAACLFLAAAASFPGCKSSPKEPATPPTAGSAQASSQTAAPAAAPAATPAARSTAAPAPDSRPAAPSPETAALLHRIAELEAKLAEQKKASSDGAQPLPTVDELMQTLARLDGAGMSDRIESLALAGEPGYAVIHQFFHLADIEHDKILTLTHHPQMVYALLRVIALHPDDTARVASYLMRATKDRPQSFIRREIYNFLPVFLNLHRGRYPDVQRSLEDDIVDQLENGGDYLYKVSLAMRDLGFVPPIEPLVKLLLDPSKRPAHGEIIQLLATRGEDGMKALARYVDETREPRLPSVGEALRTIYGMDPAKGPATVRGFFSHKDPEIRRSALLSHFSFHQEMDSYPLAVDYLNSNIDFKLKRNFVNLLRQRNREILDEIMAQPAAVLEKDVREMVVKDGAPRPRKEETPEKPEVTSPEKNGSH